MCFLQAWRHKDLRLYMFKPMLAYQTFEATSLTDLAPSQGNFVRRLANTKAFRKLREWAIDPYTHQPWTHVLAEPLLQVVDETLVLHILPDLQ